MKSKLTKKTNPELDPDDDDFDVESSGPAIAAAKKSKVTLIAASSILITVVLYFLFFKTPEKPPEKYVEVPSPKGAQVAPNEEGKSPFEIDVPLKAKEDLTTVEKPTAPEVPTLPSLPEGSVLPEQISLSPTEPVNPVQPINPIQPTPTDPVQQPAQVVTPNPEPVVKKKEIDPRYAPIIVFSGAAEGSPSRGVGYDKNIVKLNEDPIDKLTQTKTGVSATYINDRSHTIAQGKLLTAVLETAINTEIPGSVRGVVSRDVYGESGNEVLIPRGSRLFGSYSSTVSQGQGRVEISWTRLIRPDGVDLAISFNASDQFGRSGIPGEVDNKYGSIVASSMLTSILAVGGVAAAQKLLTNNATTTTTTNPTQGTTTTTGSAANQAIYDVSKTIIDTVGQVVGNSIDVDPVIRVPQGTRVTVIVNSDINVPSMSNR